MFNSLFGMREEVIKSILRKVGKDLKLLDIAIDIIAFFTIGFTFSLHIFNSLQHFFHSLIVPLKEGGDSVEVFEQFYNYIILLKASMIFHSGYPEIYLPLLQEIDTVFGDYIDEGEEEDRIQSFIDQYKLNLGEFHQQNKGDSVSGDIALNKRGSGPEKVKFKYKGFINMGNT